MKWIKDRPATDRKKEYIFTDGKRTYFGKLNFQGKYQDYAFGIISDVIAGTDEPPEIPVFSLGRPVNGDFKGWEHKLAPEDGVYILVANEQSKINIARFDSGWVDRSGNKLEDVLCSMAFPPL